MVSQVFFFSVNIGWSKTNILGKFYTELEKIIFWKICYIEYNSL